MDGPKELVVGLVPGISIGSHVTKCGNGVSSPKRPGSGSDSRLG